LEEKLLQIHKEMAGVLGAVAGAVERRRVPAYYHLLNYAGKLRRAADLLEKLAAEVGRRD
jgi:hypothetical protein